MKMRVAKWASVGAGLLVLSACQRPAATGQVLATVGGKDVTLQDVRAEGRADGVSANAGHLVEVSLLQRVVDRTLLAQSAHAQKLDQTADAPSDLARLQQTWLADKAAKRLLVGLKPPTDSEAQAFIAAHPYAFAKRERMSARVVTLAASPTLFNQLKTYTNFDQAVAFLRHLGVSISVGAGQVDTANLPAAAAADVASKPVGALLITQPAGRIQLAEVQGHQPLTASPQEEIAIAKRALVEQAANQRVASEVARLKASTTVSFQPGYTPAAAHANANTTSAAASEAKPQG